MQRIGCYINQPLSCWQNKCTNIIGGIIGKKALDRQVRHNKAQQQHNFGYVWKHETYSRTANKDGHTSGLKNKCLQVTQLVFQNGNKEILRPRRITLADGLACLTISEACYDVIGSPYRERNCPHNDIKKKYSAVQHRTEDEVTRHCPGEVQQCF